MKECSKYSYEELAEYCESQHEAFQCIRNTDGLWLISAYHNEGDRSQYQDYVILRNKILYGSKKVGEIVRRISKTRRVNYYAAALSTRFELYYKIHVTKNTVCLPHDIIEFRIGKDSDSNGETAVKLTRLKECLIYVCQLHVIDCL